MKLKVVRCDQVSGVSKTSGKPFSFITGDVISEDGQLFIKVMFKEVLPKHTPVTWLIEQGYDYQPRLYVVRV